MSRRYIVDYPAIIRYIANVNNTRCFELTDVILRTFYRLGFYYPERVQYDSQVFLLELEEVLYHDFEAWMVDLENETGWFMIMDYLELDDNIERLTRWWFEDQFHERFSNRSTIHFYTDRSFIFQQ